MELQNLFFVISPQLNITRICLLIKAGLIYRNQMYKHQVTAFAITRVGCLEKEEFNISVLRSKSF